MREQVDKIKQNYLNQDDYEQIDFNGKDLDSDLLSLDEVIRTVSMFYTKKVVIANSVKDKHCKQIEEIASKDPQQTILILKDGNLNKSSKIRVIWKGQKFLLLPAMKMTAGQLWRISMTLLRIIILRSIEI